MSVLRAENQDKAAICVSSLCAIHCLLTPFALIGSSLGVVSWLADTEWLHYLLFMPMLALMILSMPAGYKTHARSLPSILAVLGISLFIASLWQHDGLGTVLSIGGSFLLIFAHLKNLRLTQAFTSQI